MGKRFFLLPLFASLAFRPRLAAQSPSLSIQVDHPTAKVSPMFYGLMTEEINFSYDGGLYAELIRDRAVGPGRRPLFHWTQVARGDSVVDVSLDDHTGPSTALPRSIKVTVTCGDRCGARGYAERRLLGHPGAAEHHLYRIVLRQGRYRRRSDDRQPGERRDGATAASATVSGVTTEWKQYTSRSRPGRCRLPPTIIFNSRLRSRHGVVRPGVAVSADLSRSAQRQPHRPDGEAGGDASEVPAPAGRQLSRRRHIAERFEWKKTIGPLVDRPTHPSPWRYRSSDGMGLLEFLEWCEDLKMEPVLAVYAGYSLMQEHVDPGPALEPYVQDALDEIEYVTGDANTKWGAERAKDGHPAPFPLHYVEIGNEDWFDRSGTYDGRFAQFYKAIKAKYPNLQLIATTPVKSVKPDVLDEHYYMSAEKSFSDARPLRQVRPQRAEDFRRRVGHARRRADAEPERRWAMRRG